MPTELELGSPQVRNYQEDKSEDARVDDMHSLEEAVLIRTARYHQGLCRYHNQNIQHHVFAVGDLVLRRVQSSKDRHKLSPMWEGPYKVVEVTRPGTYRLKTQDGV